MYIPPQHDPEVHAEMAKLIHETWDAFKAWLRRTFARGVHPSVNADTYVNVWGVGELPLRGIDLGGATLDENAAALDRASRALRGEHIIEPVSVVEFTGMPLTPELQLVFGHFGQVRGLWVDGSIIWVDYENGMRVAFMPVTEGY